MGGYPGGKDEPLRDDNMETVGKGPRSWRMWGGGKKDLADTI